MKLTNKGKMLGLILNLSIAVFGVWLIFYPSTGISMFKFYMGIFLLIVSAIMFIRYYRSEIKETTVLLQAILAGMFGIIFLMSMTMTSILLGMILMVFVFLDGVIHIRLSLAYQKLKLNRWWLLMLYGVGAVLLSVYLLFNLTISAKAIVIITGVFIVTRSVFVMMDQLIHEDDYYTALN